MKFNNEQKDLLAGYLIDLSKFSFTALVVGKFVTPDIKNWVFVVGMVFTVATVVISLLLKKRGG